MADMNGRKTLTGAMKDIPEFFRSDCGSRKQTPLSAYRRGFVRGRMLSIDENCSFNEFFVQKAGLIPADGDRDSPLRKAYDIAKEAYTLGHLESSGIIVKGKTKFSPYLTEYRPLEDSTLQRLTKKRLIELLRLVEYNYNASLLTNANQYNYIAGNSIV